MQVLLINKHLKQGKNHLLCFIIYINKIQNFCTASAAISENKNLCKTQLAEMYWLHAQCCDVELLIDCHEQRITNDLTITVQEPYKVAYFEILACQQQEAMAL